MSENQELLFIYKDARGNVSLREIIYLSESSLYLQGMCKTANAYRTFRKDRIVEMVDDRDKVDALIERVKKYSPPPAPKGTGRPFNDKHKPEICFTGFPSKQKQALAKLAEAQGMFVCKSVTVNLIYLCCGARAGVKKRELARKKGALLLSEQEFKTLLETGEIPEVPAFA